MNRGNVPSPMRQWWGKVARKAAIVGLAGAISCVSACTGSKADEQYGQPANDFCQGLQFSGLEEKLGAHATEQVGTAGNVVCRTTFGGQSGQSPATLKLTVTVGSAVDQSKPFPATTVGPFSDQHGFCAHLKDVSGCGWQYLAPANKNVHQVNVRRGNAHLILSLEAAAGGGEQMAPAVAAFLESAFAALPKATEA